MSDEGIDLGIEGLLGARTVGSGGFGTVYLATESDFGRQVAVKILHNLSEADRRRFERERLSMGRLHQHPNVVTPYRSGFTAAGQPFLVMEYLDGGSLADLQARVGAIGWSTAVAYVIPVADALGHGHALGVLHRDVKPENILLTAAGIPKLTDFGIAALQERTATSVIGFTLAFAPPETFSGGVEQRDARSDLYSLAATLYTLVGGHPPFGRTDQGEAPLSYMMRIAHNPVPAIGEARADRFLQAALAKNPNHRPPDAARFVAALRATVDGEPAPVPPASIVGVAPSPPAPSSPSGPGASDGQTFTPGTVVPDPSPAGHPYGAGPPGTAGPGGGWAPPGTVPPGSSPAPPGQVGPGSVVAGPDRLPTVAGVPPTPGGVAPGGPPGWGVDGPPVANGPGPGTGSSRNRLPLIAALVAAVAVVVAGGVAVAMNLGSGDDPGSGAAQQADDGAPLETADSGSDGSDSDGDPASGEADPPTSETTATTDAPETTVAPVETTIPTDLAGTSVVIVGPERSNEGEAIQAALDVYAAQTGIDITYQGSADWQAEITSGVAAGSPPDIAMLTPQVLADLAADGSLQPLSSDVASVAASTWPAGWIELGAVDATSYAVPVKADLKSLVWYQPARFEALGYEIPQTWDELLALTEQAILDGVTPWCVGIESGAATGWPFTDWVEDLVLRRHGPDVYDQWVAGDVRFTDPRIVGVFDEVRDLWSTDGAVFAAGGSIATTSFGDNAQPLLQEDCLMHRQASFFAGFFTTLSPIGVFPLPPTGTDRPAVVSGIVAAALVDRPEVWAVLTYLASPEYANARQEAQSALTGPGGPSGFLTAVRGGDPTLYTPLEQSMLGILADADIVRFDASDLMPSAVGAASFWSEGTAFVDGVQDAATTTANIDATWPR